MMKKQNLANMIVVSSALVIAFGGAASYAGPITTMPENPALKGFFEKAIEVELIKSNVKEIRDVEANANILHTLSIAYREVAERWKITRKACDTLEKPDVQGLPDYISAHHLDLVSQSVTLGLRNVNEAATRNLQVEALMKMTGQNLMIAARQCVLKFSA